MTATQEQTDYFVSICVMTEGTNLFGHSYLMLSQLDRNKNDAKVEMLEGIGFYSRYMPLVGYKPISWGRVKVENSKDLINRGGMSHKTFKISQEEAVALFASINS